MMAKSKRKNKNAISKMKLLFIYLMKSDLESIKIKISTNKAVREYPRSAAKTN